MKSRLGLFLILIFFISLFFLGCAYNVSIVVRDAKKNDIATLLKDFAGINGYNITYANDETGVYRVVLGTKAIGGTEKSETFSTYDTFKGKDGKTMLGQSTTVTRYNPPEQLIAALAVTINQNGNDVILTAQSAGNLDTGRAFDVFIQSLQNKGYKVDYLK